MHWCIAVVTLGSMLPNSETPIRGSSAPSLFDTGKLSVGSPAHAIVIPPYVRLHARPKGSPIGEHQRPAHCLSDSSSTNSPVIGVSMLRLVTSGFCAGASWSCTSSGALLGGTPFVQPCDSVHLILISRALMNDRTHMHIGSGIQSFRRSLVSSLLWLSL